MRGKNTTLELLRTMPTEELLWPVAKHCSEHWALQEQKLCYESFFTFALMWTLGGAVADVGPPATTLWASS